MSYAPLMTEFLLELVFVMEGQRGLRILETMVTEYLQRLLMSNQKITTFLQQLFSPEL